MVLKIVSLAVGLLEVASDRRPVDGGALLQLDVNMHKQQQMPDCSNVDSENIATSIADSINTHDNGPWEDATVESAFDLLAEASAKIQDGVKKAGQGMMAYGMGLAHAHVKGCPAPAELDPNVCSIMEFMEHLGSRFHVDPTYGNSPLAVCEDWEGSKLSLLWKTPAMKPDDAGKKPDGAGKKPDGAGKKPDGAGKKPGGDKPTDTPEDCDAQWAEVADSAKDVMATIHEIEGEVIHHGLYLKWADGLGELDGMSQEHLNKVCPVGEMMSWLRAVFGN